MNELKSHGQFPSIIYKVFNNITYANDFLNGKIRFANIFYYKNIEDSKRRDEKEGEGKIIFNGKEKHTMFASNDTYVFCFHKSIESAKNSKFGNIIVEIKNPKKLADEITNYLSKQENKYFGGIEGVEIEYNYGEETAKKLNSFEMTKLIYSQKPKSYSYEDEFRFIFIQKSINKEFIFVNLERRLDNIKIL